MKRGGGGGGRNVVELLCGREGGGKGEEVNGGVFFLGADMDFLHI